MALSREQILQAIRETASANGGRPLGRERFFAETGIREADWAGRYWARWSDAVRAAGLQPNSMQTRRDDAEVLALLAIETRRLGRLPTNLELRLRRREDPEFPSDGVFARLGSRAVLASKLLAYCEATDGLDDVVAVAASLVQAPDESDEPTSKAVAAGDAEDAFVYLLKMGRYYKIGWTRSLGRRQYDLAIQLPEPATQVHAIRTDDPTGIERYWHKRFEPKRKNGEWFDLSAAEINAFRRRKFM